MSIKFRQQISFNNNDWTRTRDKTGRTYLVADDKGVNFRTSKLLSLLVKNEAATARQLLAALKKIHPSYTNADLQQPFKHMEALGILVKAGKGSATTYSLTKSAARVWSAATK